MQVKGAVSLVVAFALVGAMFFVSVITSAVAACSIDASGAREPDGPSADVVDAGGVDADAEAKADAPATCTPVVPPSVCLDYEVRNPTDLRHFVEYPLACAPAREACFDYSLDPMTFSSSTWATCCPAR